MGKVTLLLLLLLCLGAGAEPVREFLPVRYGDLNEVKALLASLVPDVKYGVDIAQGVLILEGEPGAIDQVKELLAEFDRPVEQLVVDCKAVALTAAGYRPRGLSYPAPKVSVFDVKVLARTPFVVISNLQFLVSQNEARILANDRLAVVSGQETAFRLTGRAPLVWLGPAEAGVTVSIRPEVKADGYLQVHLGVSHNLWVPGENGHITYKNLRIKDGDTIVVSGFITTDDIEAAHRFPELLDVPHLGPLLREAGGTHREIVLMLTPHIMK